MGREGRRGRLIGFMKKTLKWYTKHAARIVYRGKGWTGRGKGIGRECRRDRLIGFMEGL